MNRRRVIRTSLRVTLTLNPRRVSMGTLQASESSAFQYSRLSLVLVVVHIGILIIYTTEYYNLCSLGELLRQVAYFL